MKARNRIAWDILFVIAGGILCMGLIDGSLSLSLGGTPAQAQKAQSKAGGEEETGPYDVATGWPRPLGHPRWALGSDGGVFADAPHRTYLPNPGQLPSPQEASER